MTGWYKRAALAGNINFVIETWLRNCRNAFDSASIHDDITNQMEGPDDQATLNVAIESASNKIAREQGGQLTPSQQELVQNLQARNGSIQQQDPFAMSQIPEINPIGSLEQPNTGMGQTNEMEQF